ncbi:MAG: carboxypeptidase-like regulatory domain-containing protein [Bacteroidia bacterium]
MKKIIYLLTLCTAIIFLITSSCKKNNTEGDDIDPPINNTTTSKATIAGMVTDDNNYPVNGASVTVSGKTTTTNQYGIFMFDNVDVDPNRTIMQFEKSGLIKRMHGFKPFVNKVNYLKITMLRKINTSTFSSSSNGNVSLPDGSNVQFQANSFLTSTGTPYSGSVSVVFKHLSPDNPNFGFSIPGGDLAGKNSSGQAVTLYTYGMLDVILEGSGGQELQIDSLKPAAIKLPIAASQLATAPATIPLWYFDETTAKWIEQGTATKIGNNYIGTVKHFSWWNYDIGASSPLVKGKVVDCAGNPMPNITVTFNGWATTITNSNGEYQGQVPSGITITVQVLVSNNTLITVNSPVMNVPPLSANQIYVVPDITVNCVGRIMGTLKGCNNQQVNGLVMLMQSNNTVTYQVTNNSNFSITCASNTQYNLTAYLAGNFLVAATQIVNSPSNLDTLNVGNISLCGTTGIVDNFFACRYFIDGYNMFHITPTLATAQIDSTAPVYITIEGISPPNIPTYVYISISDTILGTYLWVSGSNQINIEVFDSLGFGTYFGSNYQNCFGSITLTELGGIGGKVKGFYSGVAVCPNAGLDTVTIQGTFNVIRTY